MATPLPLNAIVAVQVVTFDAPQQQIAIGTRYWIVSSFGVPGMFIYTTDVAIHFDALLAPLYKAIIYNTASYYGTRVRQVYPVSPEVWRAKTTNQGIGTAGATALPPQTCGLLRFVSDVIGKKGEGRQYLPFPAQDDNQTSGTPTVGYQTRAAALGVQLETPQSIPNTLAQNASFTPVIYAARPAVTQTPITQAFISPSWATQRRRSAYGRFNVPPF